MSYSFRLPFDADSIPDTSISCSDSLTKGEFKDDTDVNKILEKFIKTGLLEHQTQFQGRYDDFSDAADYRTCLHQVMQADAMFSSLPASVRARFENDPATFLAFAQDEQNSAEMVNLGLREAPVTDVSQSEILKKE